MAREQFQTLTEPMYYILLALTRECCGVDIMERVRQISKGRVKVGPGTLYAISHQNIIPHIFILFLRKVHSYKVCSSCRCSSHQCQADCSPVYQSAENTDQKDVLGNGNRGNNICQHTGNHNDQACIQREFLPYCHKSYSCRNCIKKQAYGCKRKRNVPKLQKDCLDQPGNPVKPSGEQTSCLHKSFNIHRHDHRTDQSENNPLCFPLGIYLQLHIFLHNFLTAYEPEVLPVTERLSIPVQCQIPSCSRSVLPDSDDIPLLHKLQSQKK